MAYERGYVRRKISASSSGLSVRSSLAAIARETLFELQEEHLRKQAALKPVPPPDPDPSTEQVEPAKTPTLLEFFEEITPGLLRPFWLEPYAAILQTAIGADYRVGVAAPPQHGKTELALRAFLYWAKFFPGKRHAYVTYSQERAYEVAAEFRRIAEEAGFAVQGTLKMMRLPGGTRIKFTSIDGALTGAPIDGVCVIDDPYKDENDARSPSHQKRVQRWWKGVARARRHPGTSFIVMATRWHVSDFTGYVTRELGWRYINLKAIAEPASNDDFDHETGRVLSDPLGRRKGESLAPFKPPEFFTEERKDRFTWSAMYQGEPRPDGGKIFAEPGTIETDENGKERTLGPGFYTELPKEYRAGAFGIDLAYTKDTHADWSVLIEGIAAGGKLYLVDMVEKQVEGDAFVLTLKAKSSARPGWPMRWYHGGGGEKGVASFIRRQGIAIKAIPAVSDKRVRALPFAAGWNAGDVMLPDPAVIKAPWVPRLLQLFADFTGDGDEVDDHVDAGAALYDQLMKKNPMVEALEKRIAGKQ